MIDDWDDAYANGAYIERAADFPPRWNAAAAAFREGLGARAEVDLAYGPSERHRFDLFRPDGAARGLAVFVHGGYWKAFDKSTWSWLAAGPLAHGWAVAVPSYTLAPGARLGQIAREVGRAVAAGAARVAGPVRLTGHSAGGHLVSRLTCDDAPLAADAAARVEHTVSISGLHDLRPLMLTAMNDDLRIDEAEARAESPALLRPRAGARVTAWVGGAERPEFLRQNTLLANVWAGIGAETKAVETAGENHFDVIDGLADPDGALCREFCS